MHPAYQHKNHLLCVSCVLDALAPAQKRHHGSKHRPAACFGISAVADESLRIVGRISGLQFIIWMHHSDPKECMASMGLLERFIVFLTSAKACRSLKIEKRSFHC